MNHFTTARNNQEARRTLSGGVSALLAELSPDAQELLIARTFTTPVRHTDDLDADANRLLRDIASGLAAASADLDGVLPGYVMATSEILSVFHHCPGTAHDFAVRILNHRWHAAIVAGVGRMHG